MAPRPTTDTVWRELGSDLRSFIRGRVSDDHVADDLLQEVFMRIHRSIDTLKEANRLVAWVYQIARNVIHDHYRKSPSVVPLTHEMADEGDDKSTVLLYAATWLDELIQQLPDNYREAVRLSEIEGLSQQIVAKRLGLSVSGAKSRVQRGRAMLKEVLVGCCHFEVDSRGNIFDYVPRPDRTVCKNCDMPG